MAHDVFISYSKHDKAIADAACATLERRGIRCWIAPRDVLPGGDWGDSILRAIKESHVMVLIFSSSANQSPQIKREVNHAVEREVTIIPFRVENVMPSGALEYYLDVTHWLDAMTPPLENHLQRLANTILAMLAGEQPERPAPRRPVVRPDAHTSAGEREQTSGSNKWLWVGGAGALLVVLAVVSLFALVFMLPLGGEEDTDTVPTASTTSQMQGANSAPTFASNPATSQAPVTKGDKSGAAPPSAKPDPKAAPNSAQDYKQAGSPSGKQQTISGGVLNGKAVVLPKPSYPSVAKTANASGMVTVQVVVDGQGNVVSARAVSGHPLLQEAATAAARGAKFTPTLLAGQPVKVTGIINYNFIP